MTAPKYLRMLKGGVHFRMIALRNIVTESTHGNRPPSHRVADWRAARTETFLNVAAPMDQGMSLKSPCWYSDSGPQFRNERDSAEVLSVRLRHTGWYCDEDGEYLAIGIVSSLSHGRFIAGYRLTENDQRVYFDEVYTNENEAATAGDEVARIYGEQAMDYDVRSNAARSIASDIEESQMDARRLFALRNHRSLGESARDSLHNMIERIREQRARLANDFSDIEI